MENVPGEALDGGATGVCWGQSHLRASVVGLKLLLELFEHMGEGYWGQRVRQVGAGVGQASGATGDLRERTAASSGSVGSAAIRVLGRLSRVTTSPQVFAGALCPVLSPGSVGMHRLCLFSVCEYSIFCVTSGL